MKFPATSSPNWQKKANDRSLTKRPAPRAIWMARSPCCQQLSERFLSQMPWNNPFHLGDTSSRTRYFFPSRENQTFTISREDSHSECSGGLSNGHDDHHSVDKPTPLFTFPFPISRLSQFTERPNGLCWCDVHLKGHTSWPGHARRLTRFSHEDAAAEKTLLSKKPLRWGAVQVAERGAGDRLPRHSSNFSVKRPAYAWGAPPLWVCYPGFC